MVERGHILFVDDESSIRKFVELALQKLGYQVTSCCDGAEAVKIFTQIHREIDLVILDLLMPNLGGEEAFRLIQSIDHNVPIFIASGRTEGEKPYRMSDDEGVACYIDKPFSLDVLSRKISEILTPRQDLLTGD